MKPFTRARHLILVLLALAPLAQAHWADLAAAEIDLDGSDARLSLTVPTGLLARADLDGNGVISAGEADEARSWLERTLAERVVLEDGRGRAAEPTLLGVGGSDSPRLGLSPGTHSTLRLVYHWPEPPDSLRLRYELFAPGVPSASLLVSVYRPAATENPASVASVESYVLTPENRTLTIALQQHALLRQAWSFVRLGVEHILSGYDHLLFLLTLLMIGGGLRYLLKIVTAFTVAHSITLSLAVLGVVTLSPRLVESGIALSIAYVAAENLLRDPDKAARWRWLLTFGFGLIHGLGFAGVLRELALPREGLVVALVSFNLGVEIGQIAVVAVAFGALTLLARFSWEGALRRAVSTGAVGIALVWFVQRALIF